MKVKNDHLTGIAEVTVSTPVEALIFFRLLLSNLLNWKFNCDDHASLSLTKLTVLSRILPSVCSELKK